MRLILLLFTLLLVFKAQAETFLYFQNNTSSDVQVSTTSTLSNAYWVNSFSGTSESWRLKTKVLEVNRNVGITNGSTFFLTTTIVIDGQAVDLKIRLIGTFASSNIWCSASGPGFNHPWYDDRDHHDAAFTVNGKNYILKYQFDFVLGSINDDLFYVLHEVDAFEPDTSELSNAHVLNVLAYNLFMLTPPIGSSEETQRAQIVNNYIEGYDVVILNEVFYNSARNDELIPRLSTEYPFHSAVVSGSGFAEDGGVMIFSRWPILNEDQMVFSVCDGTDCLSSKGVMYVEINKLGMPYHVFGTHTQAWPDPTSIAVRLEQLGEMYAFMESQNIPLDEAVIFGGDMNVNKANSNQNLEYIPMLDTLQVTEPQYIGHAFTYDPNYNNYASGNVQEFLDYIFSENTHFCAYSTTNEPLILRHVESNDDFWDNNSLDLDLSDHYAVHGRLEYPYFVQQPNAQTVCANIPFQLEVDLSTPASYQWYENGQMINGATNATLQHSISSSATIYCEVNYGCGKLTSNSVQMSVLPSPATPTLSTSGSDMIVGNATGLVTWYRNNAVVPGISSLSYNTCISGNYYVVLSGANGCNSLPSNTISYQGGSILPVITLNNDSLYSSIASGNQWYNSQGAISGATAPIFSSCEEDDYYVIVSNGICTSLASNSVNLDLSPAAPSIVENNGVLLSSAFVGNQWYDDNGPIIGENGESFLPSSSGDYFVTTSDGRCTSELSAAYSYVKTGIRNREGNIGIQIFHNPIQNHELVFNLSQQAATNVEIAIYNNIGVRVHYQIAHQTVQQQDYSLDLNSLAAGVYFLHVKAGRNSISRNFMVKE